MKLKVRYQVYSLRGNVAVFDPQNGHLYLFDSRVKFDDLGRDDLKNHLTGLIRTARPQLIENGQKYLDEHRAELRAPVAQMWFILGWGVTYAISQWDRTSESRRSGLVYLIQYLASLLNPKGLMEMFFKAIHAYMPVTGPAKRSRSQRTARFACRRSKFCWSCRASERSSR